MLSNSQAGPGWSFSQPRARLLARLCIRRGAEIVPKVSRDRRRPNSQTKLFQPLRSTGRGRRRFSLGSQLRRTSSSGTEREGEMRPRFSCCSHASLPSRSFFLSLSLLLPLPLPPPIRDSTCKLGWSLGRRRRCTAEARSFGFHVSCIFGRSIIIQLASKFAYLAASQF